MVLPQFSFLWLMISSVVNVCNMLQIFLSPFKKIHNQKVLITLPVIIFLAVGILVIAYFRKFSYC